MPPVSFPATVGLKFDWEYPEPAVINFQLLAIEEYLENTQVLAEAAQQIAQVDMDRRFQTETDPEGIPWEDLVDPIDEPRVGGILMLTGDMHDKAVSDQAWTATPVGVFFDTSALPDYWAFHEQPEGQGGQRIPQRRFIGLSATAERQIEAMGDSWLAGGLMMEGRGLVRESRGLAGRFIGFG